MGARCTVAEREANDDTMDGFQWNIIISSFPHIAEAIFERLDDQSLTSCR